MESDATSKPKRILMLLENEGFPEDSRVFLEATTLVHAGYQVTVICQARNRGKYSETVDGVHVFRYPAPWQISGFLGYVLEYGYSLMSHFVLTLYVWLRHGIDAIHMHTPPDMFALIPVAYQMLGKKFVYDLHDLSPELYMAQRNGHGSRIVYRTLLWFEKFACSHADRLIATNASQQRVQIERCGADANRCYIVRNGPSQRFLADVDPLPSIREANKLILGYVGFIGTQDGVDYMIRAIQELRTSEKREDFLAYVVGRGTAINSLVALVDELDLKQHVRFTGYIPFSDVPRHIASFDICLTPDPRNSYNDSCTTIKTMEYMALGKPTVCFETTENVTTAGCSALYAHDNDVQDYARQIARLMDDSELRAKMGQCARERIQNGLTWAHQSQELLKLYRDLFQSKPSQLRV